MNVEPGSLVRLIKPTECGFSGTAYVYFQDIFCDALSINYIDDVLMFIGSEPIYDGEYGLSRKIYFLYGESLIYKIDAIEKPLQNHMRKI